LKPPAPSGIFDLQLQYKAPADFAGFIPPERIFPQNVRRRLILLGKRTSAKLVLPQFVEAVTFNATVSEQVPRKNERVATMRNITELNILLRERVELPVGFKLATDESLEGWKLMRSGGARRLERKIHGHGWNFIKIADGLLRSGVGATSQEATFSAIKLALRRVSNHFGAVEVEHIEVTRYPWFFLARVSVFPYLIRQSAVLPITGAAPTLSTAPVQRRLPSETAALFPEFACAMPMLKELLIVSRSSQARIQ
jgi:hypothetical protein